MFSYYLVIMVDLNYYLRNYESSIYGFILSANVKGMIEHYREIFQSIRSQKVFFGE
jgi:hypothetical protein